MYQKHQYLMHDQVNNLTRGFNTQASARLIRQLRMLGQITVFGLATLSYLAAVSLMTVI